jgi:Protein of unknown function (DUF3631)/Toprim-like
MRDVHAFFAELGVPLPAGSGTNAMVRLLDRLSALRGWSREAIVRLGLGLCRRRITIPVRDASGSLAGVLRYAPNPTERRGPKLVADAGSRRELFPIPETLLGERWLFLVEGEPDAVAAHSLGLHAVAVGGVAGWKSEWGKWFRGRPVCIVFDCDHQGREAAAAVAADLVEVAAEVRLLDLDPAREDGYDFTDFVLGFLSRPETDEEREEARRLVEQMAERAPRAGAAASERDADDRERGAGGGEPVDTAALLDEVVGHYRRYVVLRPEEFDAVALWTLHTYAITGAAATPYVHIRSAEMASGKTRLLEAMSVVVSQPLLCSNISDAALFRVIESERPTLLFDEIDAIFGARTREREDLRGMLNAGYRPGAFVYRCGGASKTELERFDVFCPKALAGLGRLPGTLADRSIPFTLKRKKRSERIERFLYLKAQVEAEPLRIQLASWVDANADEFVRAQPDLPRELDDRAQEGLDAAAGDCRVGRRLLGTAGT